MGLPLKVDGQNADGTFDGFDDAPGVVLLWQATKEVIAVGDVAVINTADTTNGVGHTVRNANGSGLVDDSPLAVGFYLESRVATDATSWIPVQVSGIYDTALCHDGVGAAAANMCGVDLACSGATARSGVSVFASTPTLWPFCMTFAAIANGATGPVAILPKSWFKA